MNEVCGRVLEAGECQVQFREQCIGFIQGPILKRGRFRPLLKLPPRFPNVAWIEILREDDALQNPMMNGICISNFCWNLVQHPANLSDLLLSRADTSGNPQKNKSGSLI